MGLISLWIGNRRSFWMRIKGFLILSWRVMSRRRLLCRGFLLRRGKSILIERFLILFMKMGWFIMEGSLLKTISK